VFWTANSRDAELHLTETTAGNGVVQELGSEWISTPRRSLVLAAFVALAGPLDLLVSLADARLTAPHPSGG